MNISCYNDADFTPARVSIDPEYDGSLSGHCHDLPEMSLNKSVMFGNGGQIVTSESIKKHFQAVDPNTNYNSPSSCSYRKVGSHSNRYLNKNVPQESLLYSPDKSILHAARDADTWLAPSTIVWVNSIHHGWWPSEIVDTRVLKDNDYQHTERVLVQLFVFHKRVWVDESDLSQFSNHFEERSKNPSEAFQDALKQACSRYENRRLDKEAPQDDNSAAAARTSDSSSNRKNGDRDEEGGRGKRKRKAKIHFDEKAVPDNPARRIRRLKVMRLLGLAAPVGSPFSPPPHKASS